MKASDSHIKYGKALYGRASRLKIEDAVLKQLSGLADLYSDVKFLSLVKEFAFMKPADGRQVLEALFGGKLETAVFNLLLILFQNRKLSLVPRIYEVYRKIYHQEKGIADITLVTARTLSDEDKKNYERILAGKRKGQASVSYKSNPALIGGVQCYEAGFLTDMSVRNYLEYIKKQLISNEIN